MNESAPVLFDQNLPFAFGFRSFSGDDIKNTIEACQIFFDITHSLGCKTFQLNYPCFIVYIILLSDTLGKNSWLGRLVLEGYEHRFVAKLSVGEKMNHPFRFALGTLDCICSGSRRSIFVSDALWNKLKDGWIFIGFLDNGVNVCV